MGNPRRAGWYPDPSDRGWERYWDGDEWRDGRRPTGGAGEPPARRPRRQPLPPEVLQHQTYVLTWLTLAAAVLAAIFAFVAMRVAFGARDEAQRAATQAGFADAGGTVLDLETPLREAGILPPLEP